MVGSRILALLSECKINVCLCTISSNLKRYLLNKRKIHARLRAVC